MMPALARSSVEPLSGKSGIELVRPEPADVVDEAEVILIGKFDLVVPPGPSTQVATCTMVEDVTVFAAAPHMHWTGRHLSARAISAQADAVTLVDEDYDFEGQIYRQMNPVVPLQQGDRIEVNCDYENPGASLPFGESTDAEMCILFTYRYPAVADNLLCFQ